MNQVNEGTVPPMAEDTEVSSGAVPYAPVNTQGRDITLWMPEKASAPANFTGDTPFLRMLTVSQQENSSNGVWTWSCSNRIVKGLMVPCGEALG